MSGTYLVVQTLGFTMGAVLFVLLAALSWKAERLAKQPYRGTRAAILGLIWNAGSLAKYVERIIGIELGSLPYRLAEVVAWSAVAMLPTGVMLMLLPDGWAKPWQPRVNRWLRRISFVIAGSLLFGFWATALAPELFPTSHIIDYGRREPINFFTMMKLSAYNLAFHVVVAPLVFRGAVRATPASRAYSQAMLLLAAGLALGLVTVVHLTLGPSLAFTIETLTQQSGIFVALISLAELARFRFADVFVKRSLTILAAVVIVLIYALVIVNPLVEKLRASTAFPEASAWVSITILWCALLLAFPAVERALSRAADRWLFQRPDYRGLAQKFSLASELLESEEGLFALAEELTRTALDVDLTRVVPCAGVPMQGDEIESAMSDVIQLQPGHPARKLLGEPEVEALVPIKVNANLNFFLVIAPGERGRKLLSDDLNFLLIVADRAGRRIESLQFEREQRERRLREERLQHLLTEAELKTLRAQLNPHFLFNTLNTLLDLIGSEPEKAEAVTERLAEVLRYVLVRTDQDLITVGEEMGFLRKYLEIEQARFGERLQVAIDVDPSVAAEPIPSLILQPLVENAVKHGLAPKLGAGALHIRAIDEREAIRLIVEDDGVGCGDHSELSARNDLETGERGAGIGLRNVRERLRALYGDKAKMTISSEAGGGTRVSVLIPKREDQDPDNRRRGVRTIPAAETARRAP